MRQKNRLVSGGEIDRSGTISFRFNGEALHGFKGDTLASALLANGVRLTGRSFKFHRPRGIFASGVEEANSFVSIADKNLAEAMVRATDVEIYDGLDARSVNAWPSVRFDLAGVLDYFHRILRAGFYYKTFIWPNWQWFEPLIRRVAGIGTSPHEMDRDRYRHEHIHADVLVVGAGPSGLSAAVTALRAGCRVILAEQQSVIGGRLLSVDAQIEGKSAFEWVKHIAAELNGSDYATVLLRTTVISYLDQNYLVAVEKSREPSGLGWRERTWHIRARHVILATGALERPLVFPDNDRPGIMLASAVHEYLRRYAVVCGNRIVVFTNNDSVYGVARDLVLVQRAVTIVDVRRDPTPALIKAARECGINVLAGYGICQTVGKMRVKKVAVAHLDNPAKKQWLKCDLIAMSGGWNPTVHLFSQSGGKLRYEERTACFLPDISAQSQTNVGAANGFFTLQDCVNSGVKAGEHAGRLFGKFTGPATLWLSQDDDASAVEAFWQTPTHIAGRRRQWVDFQNDVTAQDIVGAAAENFVSVEHLKRYTTLGMAPDQGKTSNINGLAILAASTNRKIPEVGTTTFRQPYHPVTFGALAGRAVGPLYHPIRHLPTHNRQLQLGAHMEEYGAWMRPAFYQIPEHTEKQSIEREVWTVRNKAGICDYSPLGKIEIQGVDAAEFLNRMVVTNVTTIPIGKARYNLILNERGIVVDDGIISKIAADHFLVGTTSGGADRISNTFEEWSQCEWPDLRVTIRNVTTNWGVILLSGPLSRDLLAHLESDIDFSNEAFPHMAVRQGNLLGVSTRIHRVSFTGELSYEIAVGCGFTDALWETLMEKGRGVGLMPFGIESLMVMRTEKGFIHVGSDTDGTTIPDDIGFGEVVRKKRSDFVGKRSLLLPEATRVDRLQVIGLEAVGSQGLSIGAQLSALRRANVGARSEGYITSSYWSPTLKKVVALGMLSGGRERMGEVLSTYSDGQWLTARVIDRNFYDPTGTRLRS